MRFGAAVAGDHKVLICREMAPTDGDAVAALLTKGFARWRDAAFWSQAMRRLADRPVPPGLPRFGYVLEVGGALVGVLLVISSEMAGVDGPVRRCNVSSWYVEPGFRPYGTLLVRHALRHRDATYVNVSPAPETWPVLAAQGYARYVAGRAIAAPALARSGTDGRVVAAGPGMQPGPDLGAAEIQLLLEHARWDCLSLVCATPEGRLPFVFGRRRRRGVLPFAYLLYCRDLDSFVRCARPLGRYLLRHGAALVVVDADGRLPGMPGWYQDGYPKYFKGGHKPRPGDLAYTERAVFGV